MKLTPITTEIHERHHRFDLPGETVRAILRSTACASIGISDGADIDVLITVSPDGAKIAITERLDVSALSAASELVADLGPAEVAAATPAAAALVEPFVEAFEAGASAEEVAEQIRADTATADKLANAVAAPVERLLSEAWTEAEDAIVIACAVEHRDLGRTKISERIAKRLPGRTAAAIYTRMNVKLRSRIQTAHGQAIGSEVAAEVVRPTVKARPVTRAPAPERPEWWPGIEANLNFLGHKNGWTPALDLALAQAVNRAADWSLIADELGRERSDCRQRFTALTPDGASPAQVNRLLDVLEACAAKGGSQ